MEILRSKNSRIISAVAAVLLALPLHWGWLTGLYNWLSPFVMLNSVFVLKSFVGLNVLGIVVLVVSFFRKRWFCRFLCPVGLGCDFISIKSKRSSTYLQKIPPLGRWLALLSLGAALAGVPLFILVDPMAIFNGFFSVFQAKVGMPVLVSFLGLPLLLGVHLFFPGIWCAKICPLGGLLDDLAIVKKTAREVLVKKQKNDNLPATSRRMFIAGGIGLVAGLLLPRCLRSSPKVPFRPPASVPDDVFNTLCIRCGNCIKVCPTKLLVRSENTERPLAWMTPVVSFETGAYCKADCNLCGTVCPSGAIFSFSTAAKKQLFMATIEIGLASCLLTQQRECDRCLSVCSYEAISIVPSLNGILMSPKVDTVICVGCGACAAICPPSVIKMKTVILQL